MNSVWFAAILSTLIVSLVSFSGVLFLALQPKILRQVVFILVSFAVGALFGNSFFMLIPESFHLIENQQLIGILIVAGILMMFVIEKFIHWRHNHSIGNTEHQHAPYGYINLLSDGLHNFTDGIIIAAAWMVSPEAGIATTLAVVLHEVPQEISDFGVLTSAGFKRGKALFFNFLSGCAAILGAVVTLLLGSLANEYSIYILPIAAGGFIYLAGSDLIPELQREKTTRKSTIQLIAIIAGLALMLFVSANHEHHHGHGPDCQHEHHHHH